jgi:EAL domain-containing protein (putative c-di-GMP-specific phosphodiesterase class I)
VLKGFRIHKLKISQSLVRRIPGDAESAAMVSAILGLGTSLGLRVLAEGVETEAQLAFLRAHGCHEAQGYLFGRPLPPEEILAWLKQRSA